MNEYVLGIATMKMDAKFRIYLPKWLGVNQGEKLVLILNNDYLEVKELKTVINELKVLSSKLDNTTDINLINFYQDKKDDITACIGNVVEVDNYNRINLGRELAKKYNLSNQVEIEGTLDGIRIWASNKFLEYQQSKLNKSGRK